MNFFLIGLVTFFSGILIIKLNQFGFDVKLTKKMLILGYTLRGVGVVYLIVSLIYLMSK